MSCRIDAERARKFGYKCNVHQPEGFEVAILITLVIAHRRGGDSPSTGVLVGGGNKDADKTREQRTRTKDAKFLGVYCSALGQADGADG